MSRVSLCSQHCQVCYSNQTVLSGLHHSLGGPYSLSEIRVFVFLAGEICFSLNQNTAQLLVTNLFWRIFSAQCQCIIKVWKSIYIKSLQVVFLIVAIPQNHHSFTVYQKITALGFKFWGLQNKKALTQGVKMPCNCLGNPVVSSILPQWGCGALCWLKHYSSVASWAKCQLDPWFFAGPACRLWTSIACIQVPEHWGPTRLCPISPFVHPLHNWLCVV